MFELNKPYQKHVQQKNKLIISKTSEIKNSDWFSSAFVLMLISVVILVALSFRTSEFIEIEIIQEE